MPAPPLGSAFLTPLTPLIGRDRELAEIHQALGQRKVKLLTLTGPGGVGKTRIALEAARSLETSFHHGGSLVDLTAVRDAPELVSALALALGLTDSGDRTLRESLITSLRPKEMLLLLDNCESAVEAAAALLPPLLQSCPGVTVLATSRIALRLRGEQEFPVSPLPVPGVAESESPQALAEVPSVRLFLERAQAVSPALELNADNAPAIAEICSRLDGLPLALELAAARVRHHSPQALLARLQPALSLLVAGPRDLPERQRTLRATIDWSHALLTEDEQRVFRRLSVFVGGCAGSAAFAVCADAGADLDESAFMALIEGLLDKHLLTQTGPSGDLRDARFRMLETIREYAAEALQASGEEAATRDRHATFFRDLAEQSFPFMYSANRQPWMDALSTEHDNLEAALTWTLEGDGSRETGVRLAGALGRFWYFAGHANDGRAWVEKALSIAKKHCSAHVRARVESTAAKLAWVLGDYYFAKEHAAESVRLFASSEDDFARAEALTLFGYALVGVGDARQAEPAYRESLELARRYQADWQIAFALAMISEALRMNGDPETAKTCLEEAQQIAGRTGDPWLEGVSYAMAMGLYLETGDLERVDWLAAKAEALFDRLPEERYAVIRTKLARAYLGLMKGEPDRPVALFRDALRISIEMGQTAYILISLGGIGTLGAMHGQPAEAVRLLGCASPILDAGSPHVDDGAVAARIASSRVLPQLRDGLGDEIFENLWSDGRALPIDDAIDLALSVLQDVVEEAPA